MNYLVTSYLHLRRLIGAVGIAIPFALVARTGDVLPSLSAYYFTAGRDLLVGLLTAIAAFMFCYRGYERADRWTGRIAALAALGIGYLPHTGPTATWHLVSAAVFFLALAWFCLGLFTKSEGFMTEQKVRRNKVYRACGWVILLAMLLATMGGPLFWLESIAVLAFGVSWSVKGEMILRDD